MLLALAPEISPFADFAYDLLMALYAVSIVASIIVIISENRNPVKSLAWVTVLILLPAVGLVLYLFFGRSLRGAGFAFLSYGRDGARPSRNGYRIS